MLYNRFAQHVVNDKKKMYKRGSQWVVASAFALAIGGFGVTQTQSVHAAETQPQLTVQSATLVNKTDATTPSSAAVSQAAQAQAATVATSQAAAPAQQKATSTVSVQAAQPASAAAKTANDAVQTNAPAPSSASMTDEQWKAAKAKYDQAKADAAKQEAAAKSQAEAAKSAYADQLQKPAQVQKDTDVAALNKAQSEAQTSLASLKAAQASSYAAASTAAVKEVADLNSQKTSETIPVGDGGTFNYVAKTGSWSNIVNNDDLNNAKWNGNYLVQNLPVLSDSEVNSEDNQAYDNKANLFAAYQEGYGVVPAWAMKDTVKDDKLSKAQQYEVNQYAMMLTNNYRKALGLSPLITTSDFLGLVQQRGDSMLNDEVMHHDINIIDQLFRKFGGYGENLAQSFNPNWNKLHQDRDLTMLDVLQSVAGAVNNLFNYDQASEQGHRQTLLSEDYNFQTGGWSYQKIANGSWVLCFDAVTDKVAGENIATVPSQVDTSKDKEIDQKIANIQSALAALKSKQAKDYQNLESTLTSSETTLRDKVTNDNALLEQIVPKIKAYNSEQDSNVQKFIDSLNSKVEQLNPGAEPGTSTNNSGSSASSAGNSSASSAASSAGSSASSSAASSANNSSASSAASSATSSAASSAASSATSSAASSAGSSATSSASSSAASSASSSAASSATGPAATTPAGSNAPKPATSPAKPAAVTPLVKTEPASTQPLSRMTQKYGKHAYPATGESQNGIVLAEAGALIIAVLGFAGVRKYRHAK
ncbi:MULTISPECIES: SEC10/PgrA surface exclusion domain-containing protein [Lacticaseibacillus]|jgi:SEC10/PgrA surface exclusion-like protein|uniref:SEC10/PgrA surface exclusion domain-containing protein n=1 Tax=Lacticaseibacillus huelsenbergensis TaxID=3035291 RepID=A0ABY8DS81_9LACO|nr:MULTISPECIES: SEC10/PgrA surface exclusion domain-containing protein [Lacticaseibacillus]MDG3061550.1 SEC10/PgrA surface exclusion domain-containing protein [Lacticaseibacillus sp. BCRC 81376]WFB39856.1 SEC10/PgrA surface exclusion domain-containing protein [Lacticaseibacillus huelsenbergensis]